MKNVGICGYIEEINSKLEDKRVMDMQEVQEFWANIVRDSKMKTSDRIKASELIAKTRGAFIDKVEVKGNITSSNPYEGLTTEELKELISNDK